ncbi:hypothetical protein BDN70DRAFT_436274 [Pholiota conissans]|uniref:F-box domain-containing protein n=1 Tax=Pholiota conissans TaxID=109636 RepID=A0A9P5Z9C5_9AGAR|nr:hypothetical protein BDN70DRAFT_436274 [Pholiota conissans]
MTSTQQLRRSTRRSQARFLTTSARPKNLRGLPCLPDEIYLEILSHLPSFPLLSCHDASDIATYGPRRLALDALSQTCSDLRRVFLRYRWQRIEVYSQMELEVGRGPLPKTRYNRKGKSVAGNRAYAMELVRQLEVVTVREPGLAQVVNVLDIYITDYSAETVIPELARCMSLMPNLHTVYIDFAFFGAIGFHQSSIIIDSFAPYKYPQIKNANVSLNAFFFISRCPDLKVLHIQRRHLWLRNVPDFLNYIVDACPAIEILGNILVPQAFPFNAPACPKLNVYIEIFSRFQHLHDVTFALNALPRDSDMQAIWKTANLRTVRILFNLSTYFTHDQVEEWKTQMKTLLLKISSGSKGGHKQLIVTTA